MKYTDKSVEGVKIAYIGGGSKGWAWHLMSDLASCEDMNGFVNLYDIDMDASNKNAIIGEKHNSAEGAKSVWKYTACKTLEDALTGVDFVVISILPGTFEEMESDVHTPEKYGIYQSVGDTTGPGGIVRAMRTLPMYEMIANAIKKCCPNAWVINYTNPMTLCVKALYSVFPEIKAFGCCHEVFGTQKFLASIVSEKLGIENVKRQEIKVNPISVNHFTWLTKATYKNIDLFPHYKEICKEYAETGYDKGKDDGWFNQYFGCKQKVKMDLFNRFGWIAAAGDRHLAEFCEGKWYLESPQRVEEMMFGLTPVSFRKDLISTRNERQNKLANGEEAVKLHETGEEGVLQIRALLGLGEMVTNINIPNLGQIPNLPIGAVVETNAVLRSNSIDPVFAGKIPDEIYGLVSRIVSEQEAVCDGIMKRDVNQIFSAFLNDPLVTCGYDDAKKMFKEMCENTKEYLTMYDLDSLK